MAKQKNELPMLLRVWCFVDILGRLIGTVFLLGLATAVVWYWIAIPFEWYKVWFYPLSLLCLVGFGFGLHEIWTGKRL
jgi:hypothetical protein